MYSLINSNKIRQAIFAAFKIYIYIYIFMFLLGGTLDFNELQIDKTEQSHLNEL